MSLLRLDLLVNTSQCPWSNMPLDDVRPRVRVDSKGRSWSYAPLLLSDKAVWLGPFVDGPSWFGLRAAINCTRSSCAEYAAQYGHLQTNRPLNRLMGAD